MMVRISETYDLSTQVGKMGLVGIHTPSFLSIYRMWSGLATNHKFFRLVGCDVTMACASMLPADPLQIGTEAGDIAPQDMFNPILYKAVSNDSYNTIINRIMASYNMSDVHDSSVTSVNSPNFGNLADDFNIYYALLADKDGWKKSMPQSGLAMKGLYPIVYSVVSTMGNAGAQNVAEGDALDGLNNVYTNPQLNGTAGYQYITLGKFMRGPGMRMPRLPTALLNANAQNNDAIGTVSANPTIPPCYVAALVLPPAKLNKLYYRLKVTWTIEFTEPRAAFEIMSFNVLSAIGDFYYGTDYATQSSKATSLTSMVDTRNADITPVMEGI